LRGQHYNRKIRINFTPNTIAESSAYNHTQFPVNN
jgi:hypothetical protein